MNRKKITVHNRRQFINLLIRTGILGSIALFSGVLIRRWDESQGCHQNFSCGNCNNTDHCQLPEADQFRLSKASENQSIAEDGRTRK